jgi:hypothetical protein
MRTVPPEHALSSPARRRRRASWPRFICLRSGVCDSGAMTAMSRLVLRCVCAGRHVLHCFTVRQRRVHGIAVHTHHGACAVECLLAGTCKSRPTGCCPLWCVQGEQCTADTDCSTGTCAMLSIETTATCKLAKVQPLAQWRVGLRASLSPLRLWCVCAGSHVLHWITVRHRRVHGVAVYARHGACVWRVRQRVRVSERDGGC